MTAELRPLAPNVVQVARRTAVLSNRDFGPDLESSAFALVLDVCGLTEMADLAQLIAGELEATCAGMPTDQHFMGLRERYADLVGTVDRVDLLWKKARPGRLRAGRASSRSRSCRHTRLARPRDVRETRRTLPETKYAQSGDVHIAYQVVGTGARDLIVALGMANHLDMQWQEDGGSPRMGRFFHGLSDFTR